MENFAQPFKIGAITNTISMGNTVKRSKLFRKSPPKNRQTWIELDQLTSN